MTETLRWKSTAAQIAFVVVALPLIAIALVLTWRMPDMARGLILLSLGLILCAVSVVIEALAQRDLDEMEIAARGFAARWSTVAVIMLAILASVFEPFRSWLNEMYPTLPRHSHAQGPEQMFVLGVFAAVMVRGVGSALLRSAWLHSKR